MFSLKRSLFAVSVVAFALAGCGGSNAPIAPTAGSGAGGPAAGNAAMRTGQTISAALSRTSTTYTLPLTGGYRATLSLHSNNAPVGSKILLGVQQPTLAMPSRLHSFSHQHSCPTMLTIPLFNPFPFPITLNVDGFSLSLPCSVDGTLFGVSFYQVNPAPAIASSLKVGDITASGHSITFTSDVATITLPAQTETALVIIPEGSTSEVGIPLSLGGGTASLTSNASNLPSPQTLALTYATGGGSGAGSGTLFSSGCDPAYPDPTHPTVIASPLAGVPILGVPQYYCTLGTVNSSTVTFGPTGVTFTIASPLPDRSFVGLDGSAGEYLCNNPSGSTTTCGTAAFAVPTVQNVIVGNVQDLQICLPVNADTNCNTTGNNGAPAPSTTAAPQNSEVDVLVADDPTYISVPPGTCSAPAICGGFVLSTSGSCAIDNGADENGDVPPGYTDPGGPQESPPATTPTSASAFFPAVGPFTEFDVFTYAAGTCAITVTEHDGPAQPLRTATLTLAVGSGSPPELMHRRAGQH